jgi:hypothetical protein
LAVFATRPFIEVRPLSDSGDAIARKSYGPEMLMLEII